MKHNKKLTKPLPAKQKPNYKIMSVAISSGKAGMVMFKDKELTVLKTSKNASKSTENAQKQMKAWIEKFQPDCIVTEQLDEQSRKHGKTPELIQAMTEAIHELPILHCEVSRTQEHQNKYEEAKELCGRYPLLGKYLPSERKIWEAEDNRMMLFEATSNAEKII